MEDLLGKSNINGKTLEEPIIKWSFVAGQIIELNGGLNQW